MRTVVASIVHPAQVNQRLLVLERQRGAPLMRFVLLMERAETWPVDNILTDTEGSPIGVNDDRGTAEERVDSITRLEQLLNSEVMAQRLRMESAPSADVSKGLIDVMAYLRTGRFLVCLHHISTLSPRFAERWLGEVDSRAQSGDVMAHVLRARLVMLNRAHMVRAVFSREAVQQVTRVLERMK